MPRLYNGLYLTTGERRPVPVRMPFTKRKGRRRTANTLSDLPNQFIRKTNFKNRQRAAVVTKVEEVYNFSRNTNPATKSISEKRTQTIFSIFRFQESVTNLFRQ